MTDKPNESDSLKEAWAELASALFELRDALMQASLCLTDYQFDNDLVGRREAANMGQELTAKVKKQALDSRRH